MPFDNPSSSTFFLVENHQRDSPYDQIMRGGAIGGALNFTTTLGSGVYIWLITGGNSHPINVIPKTADGAWNWTYVGDFPAPGMFYQYPFGDHVPMTIRESINRDGDKTDRNPDHIEWNGLTVAKWCDINPVTKEWELTRNVMGDEYDAFNINYNELFTPWSNPSSYASGETNISVELVSQDQNGNITLKVYSTETSALALPPSKPQGLSVENETEIDFGGNYTATSQLEWFNNDEPDMDYYKVYKATTTGSPPSLNEYSFVCTTAVNSIELPITDFGDTKKIYYRITAVDTDGNESVKSEGNWDWAPPTPPVNIQKLTQNNHPKIAWDPKTNVTNPTYSVYRMKRTDFPGMWESIATKSGTNHVDLQIDLPNQQYANMDNVYYKVIVIRNGKLKSDFSVSINYLIEGSGWVIKKEGNEEAIPDIYAISQNYPNPFNPTTVIKYQLPEAVNVTIKLYDMLGREVKEFINNTQEAGYYELTIDGSDLSSGTYIYRITAGDFTDSKKLLLLK